MALALTPGYTFGTTEQVTAAKLATLVSGASGSNIDQTNIAAGSGLVITSASAPSDVNAIWIDSATSNQPKYYNGSAWVAITSSATTTGINGVFRNLKSFWASNTTWTITADMLNVKDSSDNDMLLKSVSVTINSASSGANGIDAASVAANIIYYLYVIAKADGTKAGLMSTSATSPTLPSGYTYSALVSAAGTNNSSNFIPAVQTGRRYAFSTPVVIATGDTGGAGTWNAIDLTPANMTTNPGFVPPSLSTHCYGTIRSTNGVVAITNNNALSHSNNGNIGKVSMTSVPEIGLPWEFDILTADTLYWYSDTATDEVGLMGFELNKIC